MDVRRSAALLTTVLILLGLVFAAPAGADVDQCSPPGVDSASALPTNLAAAATGPGADKYTTATVAPLDTTRPENLGLGTPGVLTVGTLSDAPPSICINSAGQFTGFDNELLRAIADKLGLRINFVGTDFSGLLAQTASRRFDVASSSITTTDARRRTVGFTNGYDFGYFSLVVPTGSPITGFGQLAAGQRIGVVQGTVQEAYVIDTLHLQPVKFPDYNTVYASLKTRQIDAWVAPSQQASGTVQPGDPAQIIENTFSLDNFVAWAVARENQPLIDALNSGLDAVIADGTWAKLYTDWVPRALPPGWKPGSKAAPAPQLPDFAAIAAAREKPAGGPVAPKSTLAQLADSFLDWNLYKQAIPDLLRTGLPNTLILTACASVIGLVLGMGLAVAGISRSRWLRWPARVYTDIFRGLPEVVIILLIGLGIGPVVGSLTGHSPYPLGIAALGLMAAAYVGEIFRSGIQSVEPGQLEASRALGFSYASSMRLIVVPQGIRRVLPALMNQFISLLKASSLVYFLGLVASQRELFQVGRDLNAQTGNLSPLVAAGLFYLLLTIPLTHLVNFVDSRLRRGRPPVEEDPLPAATNQEMI
ncbi:MULTISPECIES: ABC transporter substrate-binding protein/permease [unclassified Mycolicibacterium]|uniref:ABC transporter substrate-binding protein/permease n=1 Tax=unclassified Mycolicibacterium TaxID=2636767 RepID=UPI0012DFAAC1|nr:MULTISPECIES: ABC transporter substrate-binding protein/permease [unclassified Mycolicibacterium]MUL82946.1 ABC transporter permease subunit [Mycolicibacterium sp. CBMA 329]MUL89281.1 ABC transporter permease subunit [Mycolicibacterium sp. CBMA 331]MUM02748.1 ABC transporter permease subunit [Mycolicibacterium sp. CBMA 334]MUM38797.1 ABC transporter permease subunit [Mycolicibacterium sp. CBMA 247]MUM45345.1 ABC transporter permease subunit [Mycolicibacterium sp. CBMA 294]